MCSCGAKIELTEHYFLRCQSYTTERSKLLKDTSNLVPRLPRSIPNEKLETLLLYGWRLKIRNKWVID